MCANSEGASGTARMRWLAWAFTDRLCYKNHNLISWHICASDLLDHPLKSSDMIVQTFDLFASYAQFDALKNDDANTYQIQNTAVKQK